jgi:uncharacterized glyoxalase superfamily protein PhnB
MAVQGHGPRADSWYSRELDAEEQERYATIRDRAQEARRAARESIAHARETRRMVVDWNEGDAPVR